MELPTQQSDGLVYFTNFTDKDFTAKWDNVAYTFPANSTSPIIIATETLQGVRNIRAKFAKELAESVFSESKRYLDRQGQSKDGLPAPQFMDDDPDMVALIQKCLEPLPVAKVKEEKLPEKEVPLKTDRRGKRITKVLDEEDSLVGEGTVIG